MRVTQDASTLQFVGEFVQRTPLQRVKAVLDLSQQDFVWVQCDKGAYRSTTYRPVPCRSAACSAAESIACGDCYSPPSPGCNNNTCGVFPENTVIRLQTSGELAQDVLALNSTDGHNPGPLATVPRFTFACGPKFLLKGLPAGVAGMAGLSNARIALPSQVAAHFSFPRRFATCLPGGGTGVVIFGRGPYVFLPIANDFSTSLTYTRLLTNPDRLRRHQYYVDVTGIHVEGRAVSLNASLLRIDGHGNGGTTLSTVQPYTRLATPLYRPFRDAFLRAARARGIRRKAGVKPFDTCFDQASVLSTRLGASVPTVAFEFQKGKSTWLLYGASSMVSVSDSVLCLAFVDGGDSYSSGASIVVGGQQMKDTVFQFDLATSRLGFSGLLLGYQTTCSNFNFTSVA